MAKWNLFHNAFAHVASTFTEAGKTFKEASGTVKGFIKAPDKLKFYHRWNESREWKKKAPFIEAIPDDWRISPSLVTRTNALLGEKRQYLFKFDKRVKGEELTETTYVSFLTSDDMTKGEAMNYMENVIAENAKKNNSKELDISELSMVSIRKTAWLD